MWVSGPADLPVEHRGADRGDLKNQGPLPSQPRWDEVGCGGHNPTCRSMAALPAQGPRGSLVTPTPRSSPFLLTMATWLFAPHPGGEEGGSLRAIGGWLGVGAGLGHSPKMMALSSELLVWFLSLPWGPPRCLPVTQKVRLQEFPLHWQNRGLT